MDETISSKRLTREDFELLCCGYFRLHNIYPIDLASVVFLYADSSEKYVSIAAVGHVDAGKSTTIGRLLFELDVYNERELEQLKKEAQELGKDSFMFAFYLDRCRDEIERGITIKGTSKDFFTKFYHYNIIDSPGHPCFIKNMISCVSKSDAAMIFVPANRGGFEVSIARGNHRRGQRQGQTRHHLRICASLGIRQLIVCINKMDDRSVNYNQDRFNEIKDEMTIILKKLNFKVEKIPIIPISGWRGENTKTKSKNMAWWKGFQVTIEKEKIEGITLLDALNNVIQAPKREVNKVFIMSVYHIYNIKGVGYVVCGRIEQGKIGGKGKSVTFYPSCAKGRFFNIQMHCRDVTHGICGDYIGLEIKDLTKNNMPCIGDIMCIDNDSSSSNNNNNNININSDKLMLKECKTFKALVVVQNHPGRLKCRYQREKKSKNRGENKGKKKGDLKEYEYTNGYTPVIHIHGAKIACQMINIVWKKGKSTNMLQFNDATYIESGDEAEIIFEPTKPLVVLPFDQCERLGRFVAMDSNCLVMMGRVLTVEY